MDVFVTRAEFLDVNCYVVRADGEDECVLVDAGYDAGPDLARLIAEEGLTPRAILLTHGHPDHILGLPRLLERWDIPVHLGEADHYRLTDPASTLSPAFAPVLAPLVAGWSGPPVNALSDGQRLQVAGLSITAIAAPGHTEGSTLPAGRRRWR